MMPLIPYIVAVLIGLIVAIPLPSRIIDLQGWALAVPVAPTAEIVAPTAEIKEPALDGYRSQYFNTNFLNNGVQFTASTDGAVQPGSSFPRSELRHTQKWNNSVGTNRMQITGSVDILPEKFPSLVVAQVHDAARYIVIVQIIGPRIFVKVNDRDVGELEGDYQRGQIYNLSLTASNGEISVSYNGQPPVVVRTPCDGCYFKAGAYLQSHTETPNDIGQVTIYQLKAGHSA